MFRKQYFLFILFSLIFFGCQKHPSAPTLFESLNPAQTGVHFENTLSDTGRLNIIQYLYYYNGGGVAVGDVDGDGKPDIYFTSNQGENKLYLNKGNFQFEDVTLKAGVAGKGDWKTGVTMADVDGDGWLDIYVCHVSGYKGLQGKNELFINNHDGTFTDKAPEYGLDAAGFCTQAVFFDYDGDGDLDMYLLRHSVHSARSYRPVSARNDPDSLSGDILFRNDNGHFTDVSAQAGIKDGSLGYGLGVAVGDINGDGLPDIYVGNDFHDNDYLYYNNGDGTFTEGIEQSMGHCSNFSMGNDLADFNNDGMLDLLGLDMKPPDETVLKASGGPDNYTIFNYKHTDFGYYYQYPRNMLQLNRGVLFTGEKNAAKGQKQKARAAQFSEIGQYAGVAATDWSWSALFADLDNDGWKDLYITNGIWRRLNDLDFVRFKSNASVQKNAPDSLLINKMPSGRVAHYGYRNKKDLTFEDVSAAWGLNQTGAAAGAAYVDLDGDGALDLVVNNMNAPALILKNRGKTQNANHYLNVRLAGAEKNTAGIGAKVRLFADGMMQYQEMQPTRGFESSVEPLLHFGLATADRVDSLEITWRDGSTQWLKDVAANQTLVVRQSEALKNVSKNTLQNLENPQTQPATAPLFKDMSATLPGAPARARIPFFDTDREKLIPHFLSTEGPKIAVGDVDGDGLEDFYAGDGRLYLQNKKGGFRLSRQAAFEKDSACVDVGALFFDADGDGDLDLYVVSGGNNPASATDERYRDRLYLNDGKGNFAKSENALPVFYHNGSCVSAIDYDGDGALDLFVGSRSDFQGYGITPKSYLLHNDGKGHFQEAAPSVAPGLDRVGMVTGAVVADLDGDGKPDLAVVGEWTPVVLFYNRGGQFVKSEVPNTEGWLNCVSVADLNGDGKPDLVVGNLGLNAELRAGVEEPVRLYLKDFDNNGTVDPILSYYRQGKEWTFATKDELTAQMPYLKKRFSEYRRFANSDFHQIFPPEALKGAVVKKAVLFASFWLENKGRDPWVVHLLPPEAQFSTVQSALPGDFDGDGKTDLLLGGNFYEMIPSIGRMDASYGSFLKGDGAGGFTAVDAKQSGWILRGAVRDMKRVNRQIIIGYNYQAFKLFQY